MDEADSVLVARFADPSTAYEALNLLRGRAAEGRVTLRDATVVQRGPDGSLRIPEHPDPATTRVGTIEGSFVGMVVGLLGGPLGALLGWGAGALMGGAIDARRSRDEEDALSVLSQAIPPGATAVVAEVSETSAELVDAEMARLGGQVTRRSVQEVLAEVERAEEAAEAAAKEARRVMRERRKAELVGKLEERVAHLRQRLHVS